MSEDFRFSCTLCGDCCSGLQTIRLNGEDLELMAEFLGITPAELFTSSTVILEKEDHGLLRPVIAFRTVRVGPRKLRFCPFLENILADDGQVRGLCRLHPRFKPLVCALSPWSREVDLATGEEKWAFLPPVEGCPGTGQGMPLLPVDVARDLGARLGGEKAWFLAWENLQREEGAAFGPNLLSGKGPSILSARRKP